MATVIDINDAIYNELKTVLNSVASVSDTDDHVGLLNRTTDIQTPFLGFEWTIQPNNIGMSGNQETESVEEYEHDETIPDTLTITSSRDYTMTLDIGVVEDGDSPRARDEKFVAVQDHFSDFVGSPESLHENVERFREGGIIPSGVGADENVSLRATYEIEFTTQQTEEVPAAKSVNFDLDANGTNTYPENYGN